MDRIQNTTLVTDNEDKRFPWWLSGKESPCQCRRCGFAPWVGKTPGEGNGNPLPESWEILRTGRSLVGYTPQDHKGIGHNLVTKQQQWRQRHSFFESHKYKSSIIRCDACLVSNNSNDEEPAVPATESSGEPKAGACTGDTGICGGALTEWESQRMSKRYPQRRCWAPCQGLPEWEVRWAETEILTLPLSSPVALGRLPTSQSLILPHLQHEGHMDIFPLG